MSLALRLALAGLVLGAGAWAAQPADLAPAAVPADGTVLYTDVAGWYQRTADETAVVATHDVSLAGLRAGLSNDIGHWRGADRPADPEIEAWFGYPPVAIERTYVREDGAVVWLSAFGHQGDDSFSLFEHTPETCYPLSGWAITGLQRTPLDFGPRPLTVNLGQARSGDDRLVFLYLYVWNDPTRDPEAGVVSLRLGAPVLPGMTEADARSALVDDFLRTLFPATLAWTSF